MMDFLSGFLVITESVLKFVTQGDSGSASAADTEAAPSDAGPSSSISSATDLVGIEVGCRGHDKISLVFPGKEGPQNKKSLRAPFWSGAPLNSTH